jgi:RHS repeat-associated protein
MRKIFIPNQQRSAARFIGLFVFLIACVTPTHGQMQLPPSPEHGFQPAGSYALSNIETINTANGNMMLRIPLAALPPGRGNSPGFQLGLVYNSKLYDTHIEEIPDEGTGQIVQQIQLNPSEQGGWHFDFSTYSLQLVSRLDVEGWTTCNPGSCAGWNRNAYIYKLKVIFPDSGEHEFRPLSYVDALADGYYNINPNGLQWGTTCTVAGCNIGSIQATTGGMSYYSTDGSFMRLDIPYSSTGDWTNNWTLTFPDGRRIVQTPAYQRIYDRNNNYTDRQWITYNGHPATKIFDELGRSVIVEDIPSGTLIHATGANGELLTTTVTWKTIYAYKPYRAATSSTQHGNVYQTTGSNTPRVVDQIILPSQAGSLAYTFVYNAPNTDPYPNYSYGWGEISSITLPSGTQVSYAWTWDGSAVPQGPMVSWVLQAAVTRKDLTYAAEYDGSSTPITETWTYTAPMNYGTSMTITGPDGGITRNYSANTGPFARQSYKTENPDGSMVERIWQQNIPYQNPAMNSGVNSYVKTEFTSIRNGAGSFVLTSFEDYTYDKNGNVTEVKEYDWVDYATVHPGGGSPVIPVGLQPKRVTLHTFSNPTPDASSTAYDPDVYNQPAAPQSRSVKASTEVRDSSQPFARTEFFYDNASTTANLTQVKSWDSTKATYSDPLTAVNSISISTQYNLYGGPIVTTDAKGIQTQIVYAAINGFTDLYPTQIKTAYGTPVQRTESREYSFSTGLVKRVTDVDNNVSTSTDFDAFGRATLVSAAQGEPEESRTATEYSDALRRVIVRSDMSVLGDGKLVTVQHYDQLGRIRLRRQLEDVGTQSVTDETTGIKVQTRYTFNGSASYVLTSNPYRATTSTGAGSEGTMGWTRTKTDATGRVVEVKTFGGAGLPAPWSTNATTTGTVLTSYDANFTTVLDQAGKLRRSMIDGLGRLARVDEPDSSNNLGSTAGPVQSSSYDYDPLDSLKTITQGIQTRTFIYDSLKRLTSGLNPENGSINYKYDDNSNLLVKTEARGVSAHFQYDALNRVTRRWYNGSSSITEMTHNTPSLPSTVGATNEAKFYYDTQSLPAGAPSPFSRGAAVGRLVAQVYGAGGNGDYYAYDVLGRATLKIQQTGSVKYEIRAAYNLSGALSTLTYPSDRTVSNLYDQAGRLTSLSGDLGDDLTRTYASGILYSPAGRLVKEQFGTATPIYNKLFYNSRGQLAEIRASTSYTGPTDYDANRGAIVNSYSSQCIGLCSGLSMPDNNGNLRQQDIQIPNADIKSQFYEYDNLNRLLSARETVSGTNQWRQWFSYDRWGNRTIDTTITPQDGSRTYGLPFNSQSFEKLDAANQLYAPGDLPLPMAQRRMQYDAVGNLTHDSYTGAGGRTYDADNKITSAWGGINQAQLYAYDASGQRIKRTVNGVETWQVYGFGGELLAEYPVNGDASTPQKEYAYRNGQLLVKAAPASSSGGPPTSGLVGHWKFDENSGTTAADFSGNNNTGTLTSGASWATGQSGAATSLDGVNDYVQVGPQSSLAMTTAATFSAWIYPTGSGSLATYGGIILDKESEYEIARFADGTINWAFANTSPGYNWINTGYVAPLNQWTHITITYDNGVIKTYANGSLTHTHSGTGAIGDANTSWNDFRIGGRQAGSQHFQGRIDEVRVYNRALSASEVTTLSVAGPSTSGLAGYWKFDENSGTTAADLSGNNNTGTLTSGASWATGQSGAATSLDGVNDYVQVGPQSSLAMTTAATFSAWIYPTGPGSLATYGGIILDKESEYEIARFTDGTIAWAFANTSPGYTWINTGYVAPLNQWTHLTITYDNGVVKTYANGSLTHTHSGTGAIGDANTSWNDFRIGGRQAGSQHFHGRIDEVRVYNRALSASEVGMLSGGSTAPQIHWLVTDHLGTPRMVFDQTGTLASMKRHDYLPFGEELFAPTGGRGDPQGYAVSDGVRQQFTSKERDVETGLDYFGARYYSGAQGRFTSPDEFTGGPDEYYEFHNLAAQNPTFYADPTDPQSLNKYVYCYNNPLLYTDPDGHQGVREWSSWAWNKVPSWESVKQTASSAKTTAVETVNGAASALSEDNGMGRMNEPQNKAGRAIGHGLALVQSGVEIVGGVKAIAAGSAGAIVTSPAAGTGVGAVLPAAGVGVVVVGTAGVLHGVAVGANTLGNIFSQGKDGHPNKDNSVQGAQDQAEDISKNQAEKRRVGQGEAINSVEKSTQNAKNALKKVKNLKDAIDDDR